MEQIKIHTMQCGTMHPPARKSIFAPWLNLPVWCFLIEHPKGNVLIDTGFGLDPLPDRVARYFMPEIPEDQQIVNQLSKRGFQPEDIDYVILTDLHPDHTGGLHSLKGVMKILVAEDEYYWQCRKPFDKEEPSFLFEDTGLETYNLYGNPIFPSGKVFDFFDDGSFTIVMTNGQTLANVSILLQNNGNKVLLSGEATLENRTFETFNIYHPSNNKKSVKWIEEITKSVGCIASIASHDTEEIERTILL